MTKIVGGDFFLEGEREKEVLRKQITGLRMTD